MLIHRARIKLRCGRKDSFIVEPDGRALDDAGTSMKFSSINLNEPGIELPLRFVIKVTVEYRPDGNCEDFAPVLYSDDPEQAAEAVVRERGWDKLPGYDPKDVWVNGGF
jgi:hypothetical protein